MNLQYGTGIYALLTYLTSYLCMPEHHVICKENASKEAYNKKVKEKLWCFSNVVFWIKWEVSLHEAIQRVLSMPMRHSNSDVFLFL